jgi:hypothetical protein
LKFLRQEREVTAPLQGTLDQLYALAAATQNKPSLQNMPTAKTHVK